MELIRVAGEVTIFMDKQPEKAWVTEHEWKYQTSVLTNLRNLTVSLCN